MRMGTIVAMAVALAASGTAFAQSGWYAGVSAGESRTSNDLVTNRESTVVNATITGSTFDGKDTGVRLFTGYRFSPWISVEANYADLGHTKLETGTLASDPPMPGTYTQKRSVSGFGVGVVASAPLWQRGAVYARVSAQQARTESDVTLAGNIEFTNGNPQDRHRSTTNTEVIGAYAVGAEWMIDPNVGLRLEWERWPKVGKAFEVGGTGTTGEADMDFYSLGLLYRF